MEKNSFYVNDIAKKSIIYDKLLSRIYRDDSVDSDSYYMTRKTEDVDHYLNSVGGKDGRLYSYGKNDSGTVNESVLAEKTMSGKIVKTYSLPEGETTFSYDGYDANVYQGFSFKGFSFGERYIYYINRNGVYRCDTEGIGEFELIYDGKTDPIFNPEQGKEKRLGSFKVLANEDFYISLQDVEYNDAGEYLYKNIP